MKVVDYFIKASDLPFNNKFYNALKRIAESDAKGVYYTTTSSNRYCAPKNIIAIKYETKGILGELFGIPSYEGCVMLTECDSAVYTYRLQDLPNSDERIYKVVYDKKATKQKKDGYYVGNKNEIVQFLAKLDTNIKQVADFGYYNTFEGDTCTGSIYEFYSNRELKEMFEGNIYNIENMNVRYGEGLNLRTGAVEVFF